MKSERIQFASERDVCVFESEINQSRHLEFKKVRGSARFAFFHHDLFCFSVNNKPFRLIKAQAAQAPAVR